jgi:hypothetical protein
VGWVSVLVLATVLGILDRLEHAQRHLAAHNIHVHHHLVRKVEEEGLERRRHHIRHVAHEVRVAGGLLGAKGSGAMLAGGAPGV